LYFFGAMVNTLAVLKPTFDTSQLHLLWFLVELVRAVWFYFAQALLAATETVTQLETRPKKVVLVANSLSVLAATRKVFTI